MQIVEAKVEYFPQGNTEQEIKEHVCKCSQTAYRSVPKVGDAAQKMYHALISSGHVSCLRHESCYYIIPSGEMTVAIADYLAIFKKSPYIEIQEDTAKNLYISTNANFVLDANKKDEKNKVSEGTWDRLITPFRVMSDVFNDTSVGHTMMRYTLFCTTSIDITREYNRRSPNNITEESTIFCNYSKDKFGGEINIGSSQAFNYIPEDESAMNNILHDIIEGNDLSVYDTDSLYDAAFRTSEKIYMALTQGKGVKAEFARKTLPLALKSGVVYTYSVKEWSYLLQLRYLNTTGRDHTDSNGLGKLIYEKFQELGYKLNDEGWLV